MPPVGFKRSRALWDQTRFPFETRVDYGKALGRAVLYELQPIRWSQVSATAWQRQRWRAQAQRLWTKMQCVGAQTPTVLRKLLDCFRQCTWRQWMGLCLVVAYYWLVRWLHEWLHAGPIMVIATILCIIFTIGLGDTAGDGSFSAYSVFNRGVRLLGDIQVEDLLAQHVGGGMRMMMGGAAGEEEEEVERQQRPRLAPAAAAARRPRPEPRPEEDEMENRAPEAQPQQPAAQANHQQQLPRAGRLAGKKARRRNLEQRREQRRQREAAAAMGWGLHVDDDDDDGALQQILQEQHQEQQLQR